MSVTDEEVSVENSEKNGIYYNVLLSLRFNSDPTQVPSSSPYTLLNRSRELVF